MQYISTRNKNCRVSAAEAIVTGLAPDGGLFLPETLPHFQIEEIAALAKHDYARRTTEILSQFLCDFSRDEITECVSAAYSPARFPARGVAPLVSVPIGDCVNMLELYHGPTCAFKDFALQLLPRLLTTSIKKTGIDKTVVILVATSGDTGKAALEGFCDVPGTKICVFYPDGGTSNIQRLQMTTQRGDNVMVLASRGNFDDAQNGVKKIFTDSGFASELSERGYLLSSANSINWGRLVPQIAYYFSAYCDLMNRGVRGRVLGSRVNVVVPTGNFGNILAAYIAKQCGLPIDRLICASNRNNVLTDFINTGDYDRNRKFYVTSSPSMDILISSNLERLLYMLCGDDMQLRLHMRALADTGKYSIGSAQLSKLQTDFWAGCADDAQTSETIGKLFREHGYLCDTHTAVAARVYQDYVAETGDDKTPTIIASTASPFKFADSVLPAITGREAQGGDFERLRELERIAGKSAPAALMGIDGTEERFTGVVDPEGMKDAVSAWLSGD